MTQTFSWKLGLMLSYFVCNLHSGILNSSHCSNQHLNEISFKLCRISNHEFSFVFIWIWIIFHIFVSAINYSAGVEAPRNSLELPVEIWQSYDTVEDYLMVTYTNRAFSKLVMVCGIILFPLNLFIVGYDVERHNQWFLCSRVSEEFQPGLVLFGSKNSLWFFNSSP